VEVAEARQEPQVCARLILHVEDLGRGAGFEPYLEFHCKLAAMQNSVKEPSLLAVRRNPAFWL
jgi:hypothetical protein